MTTRVRKAVAANKAAKKAVAKRAAKKAPAKPIVRKPNLGLPNAPINSGDALSTVRRWAATAASEFPPRRCLQGVRTAWQLPMKYGTAKQARLESVRFHEWTGNTEDIPYGAPVFSRRVNAPADDAEHVFICGGHDASRKRIFWTVDAIRLGEFDPVHIDFFTEKWGHEIMGWAEDLNGYDLNLPLSPNERKRR